jgi:antitoxin component of MazEF toxin-antitoxin module
MKVRNAFRSGHALVLAIPKDYATALRIVPGTPLVLELRDGAIHIARGVIRIETPRDRAAAAADVVALVEE